MIIGHIAFYFSVFILGAFFVAAFVLGVWPKPEKFCGFCMETKIVGQDTQKTLIPPNWFRWCLIAVLSLAIAGLAIEIIRDPADRKNITESIPLILALSVMCIMIMWKMHRGKK